MKRDLYKDKRAVELEFPPIIFLLLNIIFFAILLLFIIKSSTGALIYEQAYAKQITLLIEKAKPETRLTIDIQDAVDAAKKSKNPPRIEINQDENFIIADFGGQGGYKSNYFSDYNIEYEIKGGLLILKIHDK